MRMLLEQSFFQSSYVECDPMRDSVPNEWEIPPAPISVPYHGTTGMGYPLSFQSLNFVSRSDEGSPDKTRRHFSGLRLNSFTLEVKIPLLIDPSKKLFRATLGNLFQRYTNAVVLPFSRLLRQGPMMLLSDMFGN